MKTAVVVVIAKTIVNSVILTFYIILLKAFERKLLSFCCGINAVKTRMVVRVRKALM